MPAQPQPGEVPLADLIDDARLVRDMGTLGLSTAQEALRFFPRRYLEAGTLSTLRDVMADGETVAFMARVLKVSTRQMRNRRGSITTVIVTDGEYKVEAAFFNQRWIAERIRPETDVALTGKVTLPNTRYSTPGVHYVLQSPAWLNQIAGDELSFDTIRHPIPIYRANSSIATSRVAEGIRKVLDAAGPEVFADPVPEAILIARGLPDLRRAYAYMHRPAEMAEVHAAQQRWVFEEAFALQAHLLSQQTLWNAELAHPLPRRADGAGAHFDAHLGFTLTGAQQRAGEEIAADLDRPHPMNRLLHGDVGAGKTLVALRAMLQAVDAGMQAALIAPTEVLAAQHYRSLLMFLGVQAEEPSLFSHSSPASDHPVRIALLTGSLPAAERRELLLALVAGQIDILVGTHALISDTTIFASLALVVVDEQHRFGVAQREALRAKAGGFAAHTLVMTATPIPRTLALTAFGDLDVSVLDELPHGPKQITTHAFSVLERPHWLDRVYQLIAEAAAAGRQVFVVAPKIDADPAAARADDLDAGAAGIGRFEAQFAAEDADPGMPGTGGLPDMASGGLPDMASGVPGISGSGPVSVTELLHTLQAHPRLSHLRYGIVHGRMSADDKDETMRRLALGEIDVLIATTVIEVGIDVPRASMMVVFDAESFGIAQLHQLRGRIGRDGSAATCFLITRARTGSEAMERLSHVAATLDGFELAAYDLLTRKEGDVLGRSQWGRTSLRHLSVVRDAQVIEDARRAAAAVVETDPMLETLPQLRAAITAIVGDAAAFTSQAS